MNEKEKCPICKQDISFPQNDSLGCACINCEKCGKFKVSRLFFLESKDLDFENKHLIQGALRERELEFGEFLTTLILGKRKEVETSPLDSIVEKQEKMINRDFTFTIDELLKSVCIPKNPMEQIDKLLENISKHEKRLGVAIKIDLGLDFPFAYSCSVGNFRFILHAAANYLVTHSRIDDSNLMVSVKISLEGWKRIEELKKINRNSNQGFVACTFRPGHEHKIFQKAIIKGIENVGFDPQSIDEPHSRTILEKGLGEIRRSRFVVADMTHESKSVIFEAGFALGLGIKVILVCRKDYWDDKKKKGESIEFYTSNYQIIIYENEEDLTEKVENAIRARIGLR